MVHTLNRRADDHKAYCEDALYHTQRDEWVIAAVFDGCSDGKNSHFASWLHMYTLRELIERYWMTYSMHIARGSLDTLTVGNRILDALKINLLNTANSLKLTELELLSTIVLALYNTTTLRLQVLFAGDGAVKTNHEDIFRVTSGASNTPDYIVYNQSMRGPYLSYQRDDIRGFSICTDGIDQIRHPNRPIEEIIHYLLEDRRIWPSAKMLDRKVNILQREGAFLSDDVTIIRYTNEAI